jgi:hypothetical protein
LLIPESYFPESYFSFAAAGNSVGVCDGRVRNGVRAENFNCGQRYA